VSAPPPKNRAKTDHHLLIPTNLPQKTQGEERVPKPNVYNYELEGYEWDHCPSLLMYTREARTLRDDGWWMGDG
jgi:hypothetical protein